MQYDATASIVLFNNDDSVKNAINSFLASSLKLKLYLIDNSPTDEIKAMLAEFINDSRVVYIFNNRNLGYGAGHNIALKETINITRYHLVLNPDVTFDKGVLERLFEYMNLNDNAGQVIPKVLYPDGSLQCVCKLIPTPFNLFSRLLPKFLFEKYNKKFELRFLEYNAIMNIPYLSGCFMFLRCSALKEIGLFDERFFMYPEDIDLTRRMHKKYKTVFYPYVEIYHVHTKSSFKSMRMFVIHIYNVCKYFNKWGWFFDNERTKTNKAVLQQLKQNIK